MDDLKELCRGHEPDSAWAADPETGRWTPSVWDRRRLLTTEMDAAARAQGGLVHGPQIAAAIRRHSAGPEDAGRLASAFGEWVRRNGAAW